MAKTIDAHRPIPMIEEARARKESGQPDLRSWVISPVLRLAVSTTSRKLRIPPVLLRRQRHIWTPSSRMTIKEFVMDVDRPGELHRKYRGIYGRLLNSRGRSAMYCKMDAATSLNLGPSTACVDGFWKKRVPPKRIQSAYCDVWRISKRESLTTVSLQP